MIRSVVAVLVSGVLAVGSAVAPAAAQALPKTGSCPSGYHTSGNYCVPSGSSSGPAVPKVGSCPSGYHTSGSYCLGGRDARHAVPKTGSCPSGYHTSGDYCVQSR